MNLLKSITVQNFRGIDNLVIDDFADVNLLIGNNNCGKTSVLESVFLLTGISNPTLAATVNQLRGLFATPEKLKLLFRNVNLENKPKIDGVFLNGNSRELVISAKQIFDLNHQVTDPNIEVEGLDFDFTIKNISDEKSYKSSLNFIRNKDLSLSPTPQINIIPAQDYKEDRVAILLTNKDELNLLQRYSLLLKQKKNDFMLKLLQRFDKNIKSVQLLPDGIYFELPKVTELLPLNAMGGGMGHFLNIAISIAVQPNSVICIDEIESGLHFSKYYILWEHIFNIAKENNSQLFVTTHNIETLKMLAEFLENKKNISFRNMAKIFTIANTAKAGYKSYGYSYEGFSQAISHNIELRS